MNMNKARRHALAVIDEFNTLCRTRTFANDEVRYEALVDRFPELMLQK